MPGSPPDASLAGDAALPEEETMTQQQSSNAASPSPRGVLPDRFTDAAMQRLEPAIRTIWMLKLGAGLSLLVGGVFLYEFVQWLSADAGEVAAWRFGLTGAALLVGLATTVGLPCLRYRYWRYALRPEELMLERGVFNRVRTVVPLRRIQHLDVSQDLLEREFDLGKLIVHTAGGRSSDVAVPGLRYETAERLRDDVKRYVLSKDAV